MKLTEEEWSKLNNGSHNSKNLSDSYIPKQTLSDKYQEYKDWLNEIPELSDEEIEKASYEFWQFNENNQSTCWKLGAKWYREQLKNKL